MNNNKIREGDIGFTQLPDKKYYPFKILKIETWPDNSTVWHVLNYDLLDHEPTEIDVKTFKVRSWHAPIASFEKDAKFIANLPVTNDELKGYFEYLKQTDFRRYIKESGVDLNKIIGEAQEYYKKGCQLDDEKKHKEAIDAYTDAIGIFPLFLEAIDNRGFAKMDLGNYKDAIPDFQQSLEIEPGFAAQFSLGECHFKLKEYAKAKQEVEKSLAIKDDPMAKNLLQKIQEAVS